VNACRPYRELLSGLLDGALAPAQLEPLQAHLDQCPECRQALDELRRTLALVKGLEPVEPPPWLADRILERVRAAPRTPTALQRLLSLAARPPLQAAGILLVCLAGYLVLRVSGPQNMPAPPQTVPAPPQTAPAPPPAAPGAPEASSPPPPAMPRLARRAGPRPAAPAEQGGVREAAPAPEAKLAAQAPAAAQDFTPAPAAAPRAQAGQEMARKAVGMGRAYASAPTLETPAPAPAERPLALRLALRDPEAGPGVEAAFRRAGATFLAPPGPGRRALSARVPAAALPALLKELEAMGTLAGPRPDPAGLGGGDVVVALTW
jgi:hypothetical protein